MHPTHRRWCKKNKKNPHLFPWSLLNALEITHGVQWQTEKQNTAELNGNKTNENRLTDESRTSIDRHVMILCGIFFRSDSAISASKIDKFILSLSAHCVS